MELQVIQQKIYELRGQNVMLDRDLAELYEVPTKTLNLAVKRHIERFPVDFMFQLTKEEFKNLRFQIETSSWGGTRYMPYAFTELGVSMLSSVLNSDKAVQINIGIMRAFIMIRQFALTNKELTTRITQLERKYNMHFSDVFETLEILMNEKEKSGAWKDRKQIGFKK